MELNKRVRPKAEIELIEGVQIVATNNEADLINFKKLDALEGDLFTSEAENKNKLKDEYF
jgi:hypothetical protein